LALILAHTVQTTHVTGLLGVALILAHTVQTTHVTGLLGVAVNGQVDETVRVSPFVVVPVACKENIASKVKVRMVGREILARRWTVPSMNKAYRARGNGAYNTIASVM
jgi:hypothetical protein